MKKLVECEILGLLIFILNCWPVFEHFVIYQALFRWLFILICLLHTHTHTHTHLFTTPTQTHLPSRLGLWIHRWISAEMLDPANVCPWYDTKQSDGEPPILEIWRKLSTPFIIKGFRTIVFIFIAISTPFRPICPRPSSGVCRTREPSRNFELRLLLNPRGSPVLIPLAITGYKC